MKFNQIWSGRNCRTNEQFSASVPGNIQYDFAVYKNFGDMNYSDNYKKLLPYEDDFWEYETSLDFEANDGEKCFFVSDGIGYKYDIYFKGDLVYSYEGMFKPIELELEGAKKGDALKIVIHPHPKSKNGAAGTRDEADESCNPPVCYGWDWNPRILISGLWQGAHVETRGESHIGGVEVLTSLNDSLDEGFVSCTFECALPCVVSFYDPNGALVYCGDETEFSVEAPALWWCNGQGEPSLYRYEIANEKESVSGFVGFKRLRLVRNANSDGPRTFPKGRYEAAITIELNGRRIFAKGSNWVNPDIFWGNIDTERYEKLISLAKDANMNIFRMWGGAGLAKKEFYEICDRNGILVWQEFMLACNNYRGKEHYMSVLKSEAEAIIKKLRSHPSIAIWCGGNELFNSWSGMSEQSLPLRLLDSLCFELDRDRPFLFTSPLFGMAHGGYTFFHERQGGEVYSAFANSDNTAYTEFGVPSISSVEALKRIIPEGELFPPRETDAWIAHHGYGAWIGDTWLCLSTLEKYFGKADSLEELVAQSNWLQCEGYRTIFEEARRQWPRCSMAINWCFNEPWNTAGNNSIIEYPTKAKPCYEYVKNALRPALFSAKLSKFSWNNGDTFEAELWLLNDAPISVSGEVKVSLSIDDTTYELISWNAKTAANRNVQGPTVRMVLPEACSGKLTLTLEAGELSSTYTLQYLNKKQPTKTIKILNI